MTGLSPNKILIGYEPDLAPPETPITNNESAEECIRKLLERCAQGVDAINEVAKGGDSILEQYQTGGQVWLEGTHLKFPHKATKLNPKRYGLFKIIKAISSVTYQLQLPASWKIHPVFYASLLSSYCKTPTHVSNFTWPPPDLIEGEEEYEVDQVHAHQH
jgi:hypothetical protein